MIAAMSMPPVRFQKIDVGKPDAARAALMRALEDRRAGRIAGLLEVEAAIGRAAGPKRRYKAEVTMVFKGFRARAEERDARLGLAIRRAVDKAIGRVRRQVGKMAANHRSGPGMGHLPQEVETIPAVARRKDVGLTRLGEDEAIAQWELSGHDFYLYLDNAGKPAVLYRRHDGSVGLLAGKSQA